jgi:hypothetical protein
LAEPEVIALPEPTVIGLAGLDVITLPGLQHVGTDATQCSLLGGFLA